MRIGNRVELLRDLEPHRDSDESIRIGQTKPTQRGRFDRLGDNKTGGRPN